MAYIRKTEDVWNIDGYYAHGWEMVTAETSFKEARERLKEYRENEPRTRFRLRFARERIQQTEMSHQ